MNQEKDELSFLWNLNSKIQEQFKNSLFQGFLKNHLKFKKTSQGIQGHWPPCICTISLNLLKTALSQYIKTLSESTCITLILFMNKSIVQTFIKKTIYAWINKSTMHPKKTIKLPNIVTHCKRSMLRQIYQEFG